MFFPGGGGAPPGVAGGRRGKFGGGGVPGKFGADPDFSTFLEILGGCELHLSRGLARYFFWVNPSGEWQGRLFPGRDDFPGVDHPGFSGNFEIWQKCPKNSRKLSLLVEKPVPPQYNLNSDFSWTPTSTFDGVHFDRRNWQKVTFSPPTTFWPFWSSPEIFGGRRKFLGVAGNFWSSPEIFGGRRKFLGVDQLFSRFL